MILDMPKLIKIGYFCSLKSKIDFENMLVLERMALKPSTRRKYFFFHLLSVEEGGWQ